MRRTDDPPLWYLSFAGGDGWRGACLVRAADFLGAVIEAHRLGCNPGGEVQGHDVTGLPMPPGYEGRLLTRADLQAMDRAAGGDGDVVPYA